MREVDLIMDDIKVLIVDDSALMRSLIGKIVDAAPGLVVDCRREGNERPVCLAKIRACAA